MVNEWQGKRRKRRAERGGRPRGIKREREVDEIGNTSEREDETRSEK